MRLNLKKLCLFIIEALLLTSSNAQDCLLTSQDIQTQNHVFFVNNQLMRQNALPNGSSLRLACKSINTGSVHICQNGVLNPQLPTNNCDRLDRLKPEILTAQSPDCPAPATLYRVGFKSGIQFSELYRACYIKANVEAKFVQHTVYQKAFTSNRPEVQFTTDMVISGADAKSFEARSVFDRFMELLGNDQVYVHSTDDILINRGHLAPSADFLFLENKRASFKYINIVPQFSSINNGNWKAIEAWVQALNRNAIYVKTGTIGVLELPHSQIPLRMVPMYLGTGTKNPIPKWIYKIVDNVAFVTYNNPFATSLPSSVPCPAVNCPTTINLKADFRVGYTYCCSVNTLNSVIYG